MKMKRKLKGMTLMEVVVSIGVYAVIGLLLTEIMTLVNATMRATNQLNKRLSYEAKFADNLLMSDGTKDFTPNNELKLTFSNPAGSATAFSVEAKGTEWTLHADNIERSSQGKMIINDKTHYRFMMFTKHRDPLPNQPDSFKITLNLAREAAKRGDPINPAVSKLVVVGNAFEIGSNSGTIYTEQTITQRGVSGLNDAHPVSDPTLESKLTHGSELLVINVPEKDPANGTPLGQSGSIDVLIFTSVGDTSGNPYFWYDAADRALIVPAYASLDSSVPEEQAMLLSLDKNGFPSTQRITLEYNLYETNPNTGATSYFPGIDYTWNVDTGAVECEEVTIN